MLLSSKTKFKTGDERQAYGLERPEPLLYFALSSGSHSDPAVIIDFIYQFSQLDWMILGLCPHFPTFMYDYVSDMLPDSRFHAQKGVSRARSSERRLHPSNLWGAKGSQDPPTEAGGVLCKGFGCKKRGDTGDDPALLA